MLKNRIISKLFSYIPLLMRLPAQEQSVGSLALPARVESHLHGGRVGAGYSFHGMFSGQSWRPAIISVPFMDVVVSSRPLLHDAGTATPIVPHCNTMRERLSRHFLHLRHPIVFLIPFYFQENLIVAGPDASLREKASCCRQPAIKRGHDIGCASVRF